jgi:hypothetical protein
VHAPPVAAAGPRFPPRRPRPPFAPTTCAPLAAAAAAAAAQGGFLAALAAACGPAVEIALINGGHLYSYSHPQAWGVPTWIPWVYAAGGPAVGGLGRRVWATLKARRRLQRRAGGAAPVQR